MTYIELLISMWYGDYLARFHSTSFIKIQSSFFSPRLKQTWKCRIGFGLGPQLAVPLTDLIKVSWRFCFTVFSQWSTITEENKILIDNQEYWWTFCASGNELIGFLPQWVTYTKLFPFNATYRDCDVPSIFLQIFVISGEWRKNIFCDFERITGKSG